MLTFTSFLFTSLLVFWLTGCFLPADRHRLRVKCTHSITNPSSFPAWSLRNHCGCTNCARREPAEEDVSQLTLKRALICCHLLSGLFGNLTDREGRCPQGWWSTCYNLISVEVKVFPLQSQPWGTRGMILAWIKLRERESRCNKGSWSDEHYTSVM